ncbi:hypothetical protein G6F46_010611 [Rhizopus delemar]|jgi:hypothetical protein|uniref:Uncharacterized protein n=3 Tax=Rhizopus TaxID=4842 RepID=I1CB92_RHIO9|nr:hypothetical protein RO3G_10432 [Rhizopus delemar RA 99-880]KAG1146859.1 hypothetical protein G6F38_004644 [Rhizopus arrhizus]KAG1449517.1 hypothetical protein G6F55_010136 [Rhizopus delemar]KAG1160002.1 hypothetical protein G6F37_004385 [Rhizopus arrhizus]KAG1494736.1 hypothetical protein G6F54_007666 [Rhizopus delemar]|eukprot:EIE85722.1 hypothetical protein RO3G_10432 [Rhizopus delemar RA 99-880]
MSNHSRRSSSCSSTKSHHSIWCKLGKLFHHKSACNSPASSTRSCRYPFRRRHSDNYSSSTLSTTAKSVDFDNRKQRKQLVHQEEPTQLIIPPFSPTYLKSNEFPYSNFYVKLPDGRWMVRYRDGNRDILRTDFVEGYLI